MNEQEWIRLLGRYVKPNRVQHSLGVADTAEAMAQSFGADPQKARWAGLMHDIGKGFSAGVLADYGRRLGLGEDPIYRTEPHLLHGQAAALWLKEEGLCEDEEILHAISCHTIPEAKMNALDRILFTADMIEPNRRPYPGLEILRELAQRDLDALYFTALRQTLLYNIERSTRVHPGTLWAFNACLAERAAKS